MSVYLLQEKTLISDASVMVKVNNKTVLINCPGGLQRLVNSWGIGFNEITCIVLTSDKPGNLEGLLGLLMTRAQSQEALKCKIITPTNFPLLGNLNSYAIDKIFDGEFIQCIDDVEFFDDQFSVLCSNYDNKLNVTVRPSLEIVNFDQQKLKQLGINGKMMKELNQSGQITLNNQTYNKEELSSKSTCGQFQLISSAAPTYTGNAHPSLLLNVSSQAIQIENHKEIQQFDQRYPIKDFAAFYKTQTGSEFPGAGYEVQLHQLFPPKQFGKQPYQVAEKEKSYEKLNLLQIYNEEKDFILLLGTGASVPNKYNNVSAQLLKLAGQFILVDCGEATLQQILRSEISFDQLKDLVILVTHEHADHFLGLAALMNHFFVIFGTFPRVYCDKLVKSFLENCGITGKVFTNQPGEFLLTLGGNQMQDEQIENKHLQENELNIFSVKSDHTEHSVSYIIQSPSVQVVFSGDTRPFDQFSRLKKMKTVIVHEGTFTAAQQEEAVQRKHSAVEEVIAAVEKFREEAEVKLIVTHFSQRICKEKVCPDVDWIVQGYDFAKIGI